MSVRVRLAAVTAVSTCLVLVGCGDDAGGASEVPGVDDRPFSDPDDGGFEVPGVTTDMGNPGRTHDADPALDDAIRLELAALRARAAPSPGLGNSAATLVLLGALRDPPCTAVEALVDHSWVSWQAERAFEQARRDLGDC